MDTLPKTCRIAVLISGGGSTLQNLAEAIQTGLLPARITGVISSNSKAYGLERARLLGIPATTILRKSAPDLETFSAQVVEAIRPDQVDLVCMAGYLALWKIPDTLLGRVMNIHPALLPAFGGKGMFGHHVHEAVIKSGARLSGCTVHFADNQYDHGPIILQRSCPVLDEDTPETLAKRVFEQECLAYPEAIRLFAAGRLELQDGRVRVRPETRSC